MGHALGYPDEGEIAPHLSMLWAVAINCNSNPENTSRYHGLVLAPGATTEHIHMRPISTSPQPDPPWHFQNRHISVFSNLQSSRNHCDASLYLVTSERTML